MPSCALYMTPYPPFKTTTLSIYDITCPLLITSHALYMACHHLCVISHSRHVWHHTMPVSLTSHTLCLWHIHFIWGHTQCCDKQPLCNFISTMSDFTPTVSTSQPLCVWHHVLYMWHHIHNLGHHTTLCMRSGPHCLTSLPLNRCHNNHCINDITATICVTSHPVYL